MTPSAASPSARLTPLVGSTQAASPRRPGRRERPKEARASALARLTRTLGLALLLGPASAARGDDPPPRPPGLPGGVALAVERLDAPDPATRRQARADLRRRGPALLAELPPSASGRSAEQRRALRLLRAAVREDWARSRIPEGMVYVPPGPVRLPLEGAGGAGPGPGPDSAWLPGFYLDRTEVTVGAWRAWRAGLHLVAEDEALDPEEEADPSASSDLPMTNVRRESAQRYAHDVRGGRLPTRDEYLRAVRGAGSCTWPWGPQFLAHRAHLGGDGLPGGPLPVGSLPRGAGPFGALDLIGNVAEWSASNLERHGVTRELPLVWGGSWQAHPVPAVAWGGRDPWRQRPAYAERSLEIGFRAVRAVDPLPVHDADDDPPPAPPAQPEGR